MTQTFSFSDKGPRVDNQDYFCLERIGERLLIAVADGVGGNKGGETASRCAISMLINGLRVGQTLSECMDSAHHELIAKAESSPELQGMATTLTAVVCEGHLLTGIHCGDSRAYVLRRNGIKQLTADHTEVARLLAEGKLTKEEAVDYPRHNVLTSAVGTHKDLIKQTFQFDVLPGDRLLLLTDGVYSQLSKKEIQMCSASEKDLNTFCKSLLDTLTERGTDDNFTLVAAEFD